MNIISSMSNMKESERLLIAKRTIREIDKKLTRALGQNKVVMAGYWYGRIVEIKNLYNKHVDLNELAPGMKLLREFTRSINKSDLYNQYPDIDDEEEHTLGDYFDQ